MNDAAPESTTHIRLAHADDDEFILDLADRFAEFDLPAWRKRNETLAGIRRDIEHHLRTLPPASHLFVAEDEDGERTGFLHLQTRKDFFTGAQNCHIADLAVATDYEHRGVAGALLQFAERWAREHRCRYLTLGVFPGNERARALYEHHGFGVELLSMAKPVK
ncbi:MAG TPA: GNAT family N-acetyltransferase [Rudaea sp.]|jgi:ribosomal protein S18 acetylase RimI-like enzyme|uniref:GNAT family N-acetyltransferase n=1 Tax=Rudaea sp. TaxID=2136325 RepID=UPI002F9563C7